MKVINCASALKILKGGLPVIFQTDTLPAIGCLPKFSEIIYEFKKRDRNKPLILMGSEQKQLINYVHESAKDDFKNIASKFSTDKHISHYRLAIDMFDNNKFFGVGFKNFRHESFHRQVNLGENIAITTHPHQIHFEFLSELGIFGYVIMISFFIYTIIDGFRIYKVKKDRTSLAASFFILATILPLIPSGSFFTTYSATIFWINFSFLIGNSKLINLD